MEGALQQLHAQRFQLVDVARADEPAVARADVALGRPDAHFGRQQRPDGWAGGGFRRQQVDALIAAPGLVALDRLQHRLAHVLRRGTGVQDLAGLRQHLRIVSLGDRKVVLVGHVSSPWVGRRRAAWVWRSHYRSGDQLESIARVRRSSRLSPSGANRV